jgi:hypothetical protein
MTEQTNRLARVLLVIAGTLALVGVVALLAVVLVPSLWGGPDSATTSVSPRPSPVREQGARFVAKGACVAIEGTEDEPLLRLISCGPGGYQVLERIDGTIDADTACAAVPGYEYNYTYDSALDSLDFVLCLRKL